MLAAQLQDEALDSMTASVGTKEGLQGDKAASILQKLASREADRRVQAEQQAASSRQVNALKCSTRSLLSVSQQTLSAYQERLSLQCCCSSQ